MDDLFDMALADNGKKVLFTQASLIHGQRLFTAGDLLAHTIICRRLGLGSILSLRNKRAIIGIDGLDPAIPEDDILNILIISVIPMPI